MSQEPTVRPAASTSAALHDSHADAIVVRKSPSVGSTGSTPPDRQRQPSAQLPSLASSPPNAPMAAAATRPSRPLASFHGDSDESAGDDDDEHPINPLAELDEFPPL